ncbi:MAG: hypothetical protein GEU94_16735 [Micromonosporaceae bacterium]|nr:hypothetical protein [Micromonosporaceae bacterium]
MGGVDLSEESISRLSPGELVAVLKDLRPDDPALATLDIDVVGRRIDPKRLSRAEFVDLLTALGALADAGADVDLSRMDARTFARVISRASGDQIEDAARDPALRGRVLDELFRRMTEHFIPERARAGRHVMEFRVTGAERADGHDHYVAVIEDRRCAITRDVPDDVKTQITVGPADLLRLATGNASPTFLFLRGKIKVKGSIGFATAFMNLFELPKP